MANFKRVFIDLSSIVWTNLLAGSDPEHMLVMFNEKDVKVNTWQYGYENAINNLVKMLRDTGTVPSQLVFAKEGMQSKFRRCAIDSSYKASRDSRPPEAYEQFSLLRDELCKVFRNLGSIVVTQDYVEGDDIIAYLCKHTEDDAVVVTNDKDLLVLVGENEYGADIQVRCNGEIGPNPFGGFDFKLIRLFKALVGDTSDNIKGIKGFGEKAWGSLNLTYDDDGCFELMNLLERGDRNGLDQIIQDNAGEGGRCKLLDKILDNWDDAARCLKLVTLRPEWVNTVKQQLVWEPGFNHGKQTDERLKPFAAASRLVTAATWEQFKTWARPLIAEIPWYALDIETSTPDESDEWLEYQDDPEGVDVIGSRLTGMSLTFGRGLRYTVYIPVDHRDTDNVKSEDLRDFIASLPGKKVIQNTQFEGTVLFNEWGAHWKDNGYEGFLTDWLDTKFEASYVNENEKTGLKHLSKMWLGYDQVDYKTTTTLSGQTGTLPKGGKHITTYDVDGVEHEKRSYKMRELTAEHVFAYAADDTITTAALHNFFELFMKLEHTWQVYLDVEIDASYLHTQSYVHGTKVSLATLRELEKEDSATFDAAWATVRGYLIEKGWEGTVAPVFAEVDAKAIKFVHNLVEGEELVTAMRTPAKVLLLTTQAVRDICVSAESMNEFVAKAFKPEPEFNAGSPKQLQKLFYEVLALPVKVFNKPTENMLKAGLKQGTPKTDALAITYALLDCDDKTAEVLKALRLMKMVETRRGLFYSPLPGFVHWKTGRVHSSHNQCATNTRRASSSKPNLQQLSKSEKVEGYSPRVRELYVPHKSDAVIVSCDFSSQEILLQAEWSWDPELVALFVGENRKDMHSITGAGILSRQLHTNISYEAFKGYLADTDHEHYGKTKKARALGKAVNFGSQYRIAAKKLSSMLIVTEDEAQMMLDAKAEAFPIAEAWAQKEMEEVKSVGTVRTMLGAVRHLASALNSSDRFEAQKAERQTLSFRIQGSAAEMTKLAECRMWSNRLEQKFDCEIIGSVHDEILASVAIKDLYEFIPAMHSCMVAPYASMRLPVSSSISFGKTLGQLHQIEIGDVPSREAIEGGLQKLAESN